MRTNSEAVRAVIESDEEIDVTRFMKTANAITDYVVSKDSDAVLTASLLLEIETYLAAHFYAINDPQYQSRSTGDASATYQGKTEKRLEATLWGQQALLLDVTGTLASMQSGSQNKATAVWLGTPHSEKLSWEDRI